MELDMKKDIKTNDKISEGTLHEILLDIKYRLDHLEDIEADNRALMVKMIKQGNSIVKFLAQVDIESVNEETENVDFSSKLNDDNFNSGKITSLSELINEYMDKHKDLKELEEELKENKDKITPGQIGEA